VTRVAVVGTGRMGSAMATSLARGGSELILYNRTPERCVALAGELGARVVETPAEAASAAEVSLTMLADQAAVESVWTGPDGLLAGAGPDSVLVDMSTVAPEVIRSFERGARDRGAGILDAPVSGSVPLAETGKLTIMVGGDEATLERAQPVFDQLATRVVHIGPLGSGAAMKLSVNTLIFGLNQGLGEALVLAERAGIDRATAYDFFTTSAAGAPYVGYKRDAFVDPDSAAVGFSLALAEKDLRLILDLADRVGAPMPQAQANLQLVRAAASRLGADRDASTVAVELRAMNPSEPSTLSRKGSTS
jgi:3-hydroxyisobutyrate dehydrogenase/2-hydroxy-3-oxopropionate reductase